MKTKLLRKLRRRYRYVFNDAPYPDFLIDLKTKEVIKIKKPERGSCIRQLIREMGVLVIGKQYWKISKRNYEKWLQRRVSNRREKAYQEAIAKVNI